MYPKKEWLEQWRQKKELTRCPVDLNAYFEQSELAGKALALMEIGICDLPDGRVLVRDPLVYLADRENKPYFQQAPAGSYPVEVCVIKPDEAGDCARYAAVRLRFSEKRPLHFYEALIGTEDLEGFEEGEYFGFCVDAGLACICDQTVHQAFCRWSEEWDQAHPEGNQYDDYFAPLFAENYRRNPQFQREGGDWLNWKIPDMPYHLPMLQSGFGDGDYPVYWGVDEAGAVCQLVVQFIAIELVYSREKED